MMPISKNFVKDLGKIFTVLYEHFFLSDFQVTMEEQTITYGGDKEWVDSYLLKFRYNDRDIRLETYGDGLVHVWVKGKFEKIFDFDCCNESIEEENIAAFVRYTQTDQLD